MTCQDNENPQPTRITRWSIWEYTGSCTFHTKCIPDKKKNLILSIQHKNELPYFIKAQAYKQYHFFYKKNCPQIINFILTSNFIDFESSSLFCTVALSLNFKRVSHNTRLKNCQFCWLACLVNCTPYKQKMGLI